MLLRLVEAKGHIYIPVTDVWKREKNITNLIFLLSSTKPAAED